MCHPPLVCPLCSSAGGFPSPGALWLGLIGVANRLLSCPVCHELLLGLDKLTIHLVSHVPDLNLLASAIGNYVSSNEKVIHEFGKTDPCIKRLQSTNSMFNENTSQTNVCLSSNVSCNSFERSQRFYQTDKNSEDNTDITNCLSKYNEVQKELSSQNELCCHSSHHQGNQSIQEGFSKKFPSSQLNMKDACTQTSEYLEQENNSGEDLNTKVKKKANSKSGLQFSLKNEVKFQSNQFLPYAMCQDSELNIPVNLTEKEDKSMIQTQCISPTLSIENEPLNKSFRRRNTVLAPSKSYCTQASKNNLQKEGENLTKYNETTERSKNMIEEKITKSDGGTTKYQCTDCNAIFDDYKCLSVHYVMIHQNSDAIQSIAISSESGTNFPCQLCNRKLVSKGALLVHMRFAHNVVPGIFIGNESEKLNEGSILDSIEDLSKATNASPSQTDMIPKTSPLSIDINFPGGMEDESPSHPKSKEIMDYLIERQNSLKDNTLETENSLDANKEEYSNGSPPQQCPTDEETKQSCKICEAQFSSVMELIAHRPAHSEEDGCICVVCGKNFKKEQHLQQHLRTHEGKQWECDVCSKCFTTKYFLKKHKRLHTGEMPYSCETCGKTFTFQQSYHKHLLYHSDEKPHACGECGKRFKELSTLHNHERIHTGEKPFSCESCGKAFRQRVSYLVHRRIHTGVMPYKCTVCEKSFRYKVSQRTHKCSSQQTGTVVRQSSDLVERLLSHQREKPSTSNCTSEIHFSAAEKECSSNQSQSSSQHSNETFQELPTFSHSIHVGNDKNINSFSFVSNSFQAFTANLSKPESQNKNNPFSISKDVMQAEEHKLTKKSPSSPTSINPKESMMTEASTDFCSQILSKIVEVKNLDSQTNKIGERQFNGTKPESNSQHNSDSARASFFVQPNLKTESHQDLVLKNTESLQKTNETRVTANAVGDEIFNQTLFSSNNHMLDPAETDFFTMVMSPPEPTLEQMGKLTISSITSPEKNNVGIIHRDKIQYRDPDEESILQVHPSQTKTLKTQKNSEHDDDSSKIIHQEENLPREHETTANAADLSSFLQSCFDQWSSSSIISGEKSKEILSTQQQSCQTSEHDPCLSNIEDNRLQTINEESLKKLLYGDNLP